MIQALSKAYTIWSKVKPEVQKSPRILGPLYTELDLHAKALHRNIWPGYVHITKLFLLGKAERVNLGSKRMDQRRPWASQ
jgi:hypothetical protein